VRATRSELGNLPPRIVGWPAKPITYARPSVGDGRGNRQMGTTAFRSAAATRRCARSARLILAEVQERARRCLGTLGTSSPPATSLLANAQGQDTPSLVLARN
jgi:hypothetical protein